MKIKLVCDCCDTVVREIDIPDDAGMTDMEALTGEEFGDIILQNEGSSELFVTVTCEECNEDLGRNDDIVIPAKPLIH